MLAPRMSSLALLALALTLGLVAAKPQGRLLGSEDANVGEFPWVASLRLNLVHICSASIISETQMLTAAHCISEVGTTPVDLSKLSARVGSVNMFGGGQLVTFKDAKIHPSYGNFLNDIAIITLTKPLVFGEKIQKIDLPANTTQEMEAPEDGTPVYLAGWGEQQDGSSKFLLQKTSLNSMSKPLCELACGYGYDSVMCLTSAEKQGVCRGDDGAGVFGDNKKLLALVSFYFGSCGTKYPDISTFIPHYLEWIAANKQ